MSKNSRDGVFIVFDGIDGAGKTTQVDLLASGLRQAGISVTVSKEPTAGQWGQKIRDSALAGRLSLDEELRLFRLDRREHLDSLVLPALNRGEVVILDRYYYSTICYQGARGVEPSNLREEVMAESLLPDVSFILDINPFVSQERIQFRDGNPNEFEGVDSLVKVREIYEWLCTKDPTLYELDANFSIENLHYTILNILLDGAFKDHFCAKSYGCDDEYMCGFAMTGTCQWSSLKKALHPVAPNDSRFPALKYHRSN